VDKPWSDTQAGAREGPVCGQQHRRLLSVAWEQLEALVLVPQLAFRQSHFLNAVMQLETTYQHAMQRQMSMNFELICPCNPFARVQ